MFVNEGKYLTFALGDEQYAIPITQIREIIGMQAITSAPNLPNFLKGLTNLRGKIVPVLDLRLKFGLAEKEYDRNTSIVILETEFEGKQKTSGIIVDNVKEVKFIGKELIDEPPRFAGGFNQEFLSGIARVGEGVLMLLDANNILSLDEKKEIEQAV